MSSLPATREQILSLAEGHMMRRGYPAFSYGDIATALGIRPAAVHYHFPAKEQLAVAVVQAYGARFDAWTAATTGLSPARRLLGYFEVGRRFAAEGRVCPLSMVIAQQDAVPEAVVRAVYALHARILAFYTDTLAAARVAGHARFEGDPADQAALVASALVGAQLLARVHGVAAYERVLRQQARAMALPDPWPAGDRASPTDRSDA
jgi:TetR/AcrR family transcriptional repressor of nem operon